MKKLIITACLVPTLVYGFRANHGYRLEGGSRNRVDISVARPKPDKITVSMRGRLNLNKFSIKFYQNSKFEGKPSIVWNKQGVIFGGKVVCQWEHFENGAPVLVENCPAELPFGSRVSKRSETDLLNARTHEDDVSYNHHNRVRTQIEVDRFEQQYVNQKVVGKVGVISFNNEELFFNFDRLKKAKWSAYPGKIFLYKKESEAFLENDDFLSFIKKIRACVGKKDYKCMADSTSKGFKRNSSGKESTEDARKRIVRWWKNSFGYSEVEFKELKYVLNNFRYPCLIFYKESSNINEAILNGDRYYLKLQDHYYGEGKWQKGWIIKDFMSYKEHSYPPPLGFSFCEANIHPKPTPTPVPSPKPRRTPIFPTTAEYTKAVKTYRKESPDRKIPFEIWVKAYKKEIKETGEYKTKKR